MGLRASSGSGLGRGEDGGSGIVSGMRNGLNSVAFLSTETGGGTETGLDHSDAEVAAVAAESRPEVVGREALMGRRLSPFWAEAD